MKSIALVVGLSFLSCSLNARTSLDMIKDERDRATRQFFMLHVEAADSMEIWQLAGYCQGLDFAIYELSKQEE